MYINAYICVCIYVYKCKYIYINAARRKAHFQNKHSKIDCNWVQNLAQRYKMKEVCTNSQHKLGNCLCPLGWHSAKAESRFCEWPVWINKVRESRNENIACLGVGFRRNRMLPNSSNMDLLPWAHQSQLCIWSKS